ncbi:MAG: DsbA family protein [Gemmatimonadota bacterium]
MAQSKESKGSPPQNGGGNKMFYLIGALIVVAGIWWLVTARGGSGTTAALPTPAEFEGIAATAEPDKSVAIVQGSADAPIEIMEFADYSCPYCGQFASFAGKLLRQNYVETPDGPVRWLTFDFVLGGFPNSVPAAMGARCAGDQDAYWPYHDMLFSRQAQWSRSPNAGAALTEIADDLDLDTGEWRSCMSEARHLDQIAAARKYGESMGVNSTPTLFINGERIDLAGVEPYSHIEGLIKAALAAANDSASDEAGDDSP